MWQFKMSVNRMRFFFVLTSDYKRSRTRFINRTEAQKNTKKYTNLKLQIDYFNLIYVYLVDFTYFPIM